MSGRDLPSFDNDSRAVHQPLPHDSAHKHVTGEAVYTDDIPEPRNLLHAYVRLSDVAHARITRMDVSASRRAPGVAAVMTAADLPASNDVGPVFAGDQVFADDTINYWGQALFAVAAESPDAAWEAASLAEVDYQELEPVLTIDQALETESMVLASRTLDRGDPDAALTAASHRLDGEFAIGGQDHFYLEGQVAMAVPQEDGDMLVYSSTQHPSEVQHLVAGVLGIADHGVVVETRRMGGGFGGKETQPAHIAAVAAVLAQRTGRPVKLRLDRDDDMVMTGKRHDFKVRYDVGFDDDGRIQGVDFMLASRCGISADLSGAVNDRAMYHADNAYYLPNVRIVSHRCYTNTVSNTAFRGFGGPQGMMAIEYVMDEIARHLGLDAHEVRRRNLYGTDDRNETPYGQVVEDNILPQLYDELDASSDYAARRRAVDAFNREGGTLRKGLAVTPVKFGISFTTTHLNQAGALVLVYTDGSIQLNHGGTEMGQGLYVKVAQIVAEEFGVDLERVRITATTTGKVPNTSATAASSGSDLNGAAAQNAARTIKARLTRFVHEHWNVPEDSVHFRDGQVLADDLTLCSFPELCKQAHLARIQLSEAGFYATPKIHVDKDTLKGRPFYYFAYGIACAEVLVDSLTGEYRVLRTDILHDCGRSLNPAVDMGQVEGGFVQGMGWLTTEELSWTDKGRLTTHAPSTYKIPAASDMPVDFRVRLLESGYNQEKAVRRSKAVGEPPLMLAMCVYHALKDAVNSVAPPRTRVRLDAPATPERVLLAMEAARRLHTGAAAAEALEEVDE
ncbi:xanthine dehydrogenase molybdopterin binding subunit [Aquisalimonas lutea]|uniref:xanthine dehydrogenase molybdopterin binding subunit n=1 Tax=Aquisalimonas lutea TaxID=1327750 RepID=UPI0025B526FD|nr:xanthine dehydrogenase molybdopterin binding subunit [Aquisalimonas lutea]MDN3518131.1 xanthine dehydrogenase molybdopterin binding subunit [Aquisalimonas lutea]